MVEEFHKPATGRIQFGHVSFDVETEEELRELQARIQEAGEEVTVVVGHKFIHSICFTDPNGIALKASVRITNPTGKAPDYTNTNIFQDQEPVPALREEMERARLVKSS